MQSEFPSTVSYNRCVELIQSSLMPMTIFAKTCCLEQCTGISFVDSTPILFCKNNVLPEIKYLQIWLKQESPQWVGFMASNFTLSSMTKEIISGLS